MRESGRGQLKFRVQSSSGPEVYDVVLSNSAGRIRMTCTCMAGLRNTLCKHRLAILNGDPSGLVHGKDLVGDAAALIAGTEAERLVGYLAELDGLAAATAAKISAAKRDLADRLR
jgi:hypothetical protein